MPFGLSKATVLGAAGSVVVALPQMLSMFKNMNLLLVVHLSSSLALIQPTIITNFVACSSHK